jgi:asparagine synthase (glutamine-hydrolysing)
MCGIAAIIKREGSGSDGVIARMTHQLGHRGPDAARSLQMDGCDLGHTRLSIIDLAGGSQPMADDAEQCWVVFNGEIFNYRELRRDLEQLGWKFRTQSDTEVLLRAYQQYGTQCATKLNGQFAFVVWDKAHRKAMAARDRMGEKPLYWAQTAQGHVVFASEIKSLLASGLLSPVIDRQAIDAYLGMAYIPPDRTVYSNIHALQPGAAMELHNGQIRQWRYWEPSYSTTQKIDWNEAVGEVRRLVEQAIHRQMVADVPVGAFLSGGLDSSTVVALMTQHATQPVTTFSVGFGDLVNELPYARAVAQQYQTNHHELQMDLPLDEMLLRMAEVYDEPFADSSNIPTYLMCGFARRTVKVALAGDGGDEIFGGYAWYLHLLRNGADGPEAPLAMRKVKALSLRILARLGLPVAHLRDDAVNSCSPEVLKYPDLWDRHLSWATFLHADRSALWGGNAPDGHRLVRDCYTPSSQVRGMDRAVDFDVRSYLPGDILVKVDRAAMAHGLEVRAPFLDVDLVEFVLSLPWRMRFKNGQLKPLLKDACGSLWPKELAGRGKQGFGGPIAQWVRRPEVVCFIDRVTAPGGPLTALLPGAAAVFKQGGPQLSWEEAQFQWNLLCLGLWLERRSRYLPASI